MSRQRRLIRDSRGVSEHEHRCSEAHARAGEYEREEMSAFHPELYAEGCHQKLEQTYADQRSGSVTHECFRKLAHLLFARKDDHRSEHRHQADHRSAHCLSQNGRHLSGSPACDLFRVSEYHEKGHACRYVDEHHGEVCSRRLRIIE